MHSFKTGPVCWADGVFGELRLHLNYPGLLNEAGGSEKDNLQ